VFRVQAANSDGVWNEAGASRTFVLQPPRLPDVVVRRAVRPGRGERSPSGLYGFRIRRLHARRRELESLVEQPHVDLQRAKEVAERANEVKGEFLAHMSPRSEHR